MSQPSVLVPDLSSAEWIRWQPLRDDFEAAWLRGERPDLQQFLPATPLVWQIVDLCAVDLELRIKAGEPARVEEYVGRFAPLSAQVTALANLIRVEFEQRRRTESVNPEEYRQRFPQLEDVTTWLSVAGTSTSVVKVAAAGGAEAVAAVRHVPTTSLATIPPAAELFESRYEMEAKIDRGGMGMVFRCRDPILDRRVAVKILLEEHIANAEMVHRFQKEARIASQLQHPGIPPVYELGKLKDGRPYLAMKLIEGHELNKMLRARPSPSHGLPHFLTIFLQICQTLAYAHSSGVIHRDLKPANIMVGEFGEVQVMDWGLAKLLTKDRGAEPAETSAAENAGAWATPRAEEPEIPDAGAYTKAGSVMGTLAYMSPEQARGGLVDRRSDVFGLGAILCEILTGSPPYSGVPSETLLRQASEAATEEAFARLETGELDVQLVALAKACLAKEPAKRPEDAAAVATEVAGYLNGVQKKLVEAEIKQARAEAKADTEAKARADLEEQLYANRISVAERELSLDQDVGLASDLLSQCPEHLRGWEWDYLMRLRDGEREPITGHDAGLWSAAFSPDGGRLVTGSIDGTAKVWNTATGKLLLTFHGHAIQFPRLLRPFLPSPPRVPVMCVAFSPDGQFVASGSLAPQWTGLKDYKNLRNPRKARGVVHIWDAATGSIALTFEKQTGIVDTLAYSPDGERIASSSISEEHGFAVWEARTGKEIRILRGHRSHVHQLRFSPDGRWIASGSTDGEVKLWDAAALQEARSIDAHPAPVYDLAFSPDSQRLASAGFDGTVRLWETATGAAALKPLRGHTGAAMAVAFSPDGRRIATAGWDKTVRLWDAATGIEKITLRRHTDMVTSVSFSSTGRQLLSASFDKQVRVWDTSPTEEMRGPGLFALAGHTDRVNAVAFSPDGRLLASGGWDMTARLWDGLTGQTVQVLQGHQGAIWGAAWSRDGARLATASWDRTARVWDVSTGRQLVVFTGHQTPLMGLAFSPRDNKVASCSFEGLVKIWDPATGQETASCAGHLFPAVAAAFSPDGNRLASGSGDRTVKIWDVHSGREMLSLTGHTGLVHGVAFSPDGRRVASASWDQTVKIWNTSSGKELLTLKGHNDRVQSVAFSPDGMRIASASEDKTVRIWDAATGQQVLPARRHRGIVCSVTFSPDGKRVAVGSWSPVSYVRIWDATGQC